MIPVTKTYLPPINDYFKYIQQVWDAGWITNNGILLRELESELSAFFKNPYFCLVNNGTIALQIAIKALGLKGDIITTPFSYVATSSSIFWEGCNPVFADIEDRFLTIDPEKVEEALTPATSAILATHVYGNPCDIEALNDIAQRKGIKVIYDAAHCFGVNYKGNPVVNYGDISTLSFHATKLFHTVEGGGILTTDPDIAHRFTYMRNFGHNGEEDFFGQGINGKNSEMHAAMGLCVLNNIKSILNRRKEQYLKYSDFFNEYLPDIKLLTVRKDTQYNYAYFPVFFPNEKSLLEVRRKLNENDIFPRRYFYPSLNKLNYLKYKNLPVCESNSLRVMCLPLYHDLKNEEIELICDIISKVYVNL